MLNKIILLVITFILFLSKVNGQLNLYTKIEFLNNDTIKKISVTNDRSVWIIAGSNSDKIYLLNESSIVKDYTYLFQPGIEFNDVYGFNSNRAYVGTKQNGLFEIRNSNLNHINLIAGDSSINSIERRPDGYLYFGTGERVYRSNSNQCNNFSNYIDNEDSLKAHNILGDLYYSIVYSFIEPAQYFKYKVRVYTSGSLYEGGAYNKILSACAHKHYSYNGPVFEIGTINGLKIIYGSSEYYYLQNRRINDLNKYYNGNLLIGTDTGMYARLGYPGSYTVDTNNLIIPGRYVNNIDTLNHEVFVGTNSGLIILTDILSCNYFNPDFTIEPDSQYVNYQDTIFLNLKGWFNDFTWALGDGTFDTSSYFLGHLYDTTGIYTIEVHASDYLCSDTVIKDIELSCINPSELINLTDTFLCSGDSIYIQANPNFLNCVWNNDSLFSSDINIIEAGNYTLLAEDSVSCLAFDTIQVKSKRIPFFNLGNDIEQCESTSIILSADTSGTCIWSTGDSLPEINIDTSGLYIAEVINECGSFTDSIYITIYPEPNVSLCGGGDTTIYTTDTLILDAGYGFLHYEWNNGSINQTQIVYGPVIGPTVRYYSVTVTDFNMCSNSDEIIVTILYDSHVDDIEKSGIKIYPNPCSGILNVKNKYYKGKIDISVHSIDGKLVSEKSNSKTINKLNMNHLPDGQYVVIVNKSGKIFRKTIILKKK